ncbi:MAG: small basic protein [Planctomycetes bacterium]|uniref:small basic protein n=1 Tax=Candidatus Wunengus californicus TaxID=3367619 RepID=UPI0040299FCB|nr:small basic protein [Planctomycetota bacterium]
MSIDKSLKMKGKLVRPRNVFTRIERIKILKGEGKWEPTMSVFGIPKVKSVKIKRKGKSEKKAAKAEVTAEATPAAAATTPAAAPAAGKEKAKK